MFKTVFFIELLISIASQPHLKAFNIVTGKQHSSKMFKWYAWFLRRFYESKI